MLLYALTHLCVEPIKGRRQTVLTRGKIENGRVASLEGVPLTSGIKFEI